MITAEHGSKRAPCARVKSRCGKPRIATARFQQYQHQYSDSYAMGQNGAVLNLCRSISDPNLEQQLRNCIGWARIKYRGQVGRTQLCSILSRSRAGIVTFLPMPNHIEAQPNKLFEYMSASIPVIASDFPLWRRIVSKTQCGVLVDLTSPAAIATAIETITQDTDTAVVMGDRGTIAIETSYNWPNEARKLFEFYDRIGKRNLSE